MLPFRSMVLMRGSSARLFSISSRWGGSAKTISDKGSEAVDDFERRIFGAVSESDPNKGSFFEKLDRSEKARGNQSFDPTRNPRSQGLFGGGLDEAFNTLQDGMESKLKKAATSFMYDEMFDENYKYRPDVTFHPGTTYDVKDLDLRKPILQKFPPRKGFNTTTEEVLKKADFRDLLTCMVVGSGLEQWLYRVNVRFLANFITEAGIIIKRSKTGISAKAQRKIAREIKTARAFGLMPFISMGTKPFSFGRSAKENDLTLQFVDYQASQVDDNGLNTKEDPVVV